jgi:hypothetical protein
MVTVLTGSSKLFPDLLADFLGRFEVSFHGKDKTSESRQIIAYLTKFFGTIAQ